MNDVNARIKLPAQPDHQRGRFILRCTRSRMKKRVVVSVPHSRPGAAENEAAALMIRCTRSRMKKRLVVSVLRRLYRPGKFRMNNQHRTEPRELRHRLAQIFFSYMRKIINTRRHQKALKPNDARGKHRPELRRVSRHHAAPKTNVDKTIILCGLDFLF